MSWDLLCPLLSQNKLWLPHIPWCSTMLHSPCSYVQYQLASIWVTSGSSIALLFFAANCSLYPCLFLVLKPMYSLGDGKIMAFVAPVWVFDTSGWNEVPDSFKSSITLVRNHKQTRCISSRWKTESLLCHAKRWGQEVHVQISGPDIHSSWLSKWGTICTIIYKTNILFLLLDLRKL